MRAKSIHTISLLASAIAMALPSSATALGLGRLTVQSSLGQPLSAEIELTSAAREELDSLAAKVADPALYRQNNLTYQGVLSRARVSLERKGNGQAILKVVTPTPVNEPYLDLMVELNWAAGRVVREYTFLLDPPGLAAPAPAVEPVAPVRAGASTTGPRAAAAAPSTAAASGTGSTVSPGASGARGSSSNRPANAYTVRRGDSLTSIANQLRPDAVSLEQMLVALFKANPDAFDGENMNRLRAGTILTVPPAAELSATSSPDALRVVRVQAKDWRTYRDRVAANATASDSAGSRQTGGRITTQVQERTPAAQPGGDQVRVSRDAGGAGKGTGAGTGAVEDAVARDRALQDAQARIAELEKTLNDLKRAMEMRNQTMAQLQNQADGGKAKGAEPAIAPAAPAAAAGAGSATAPAGKAPDTVRAPEAPSAAGAAKSPDAATATGSTVTPAAPPAAGPSTAGTTPDAGKASPKAAKTEPPAAPSMFDDIVANIPGWAFIAGAIAILAALVALIAARRRKTSNFEDSIISGTDIKSNTVFGSTGGGIVNTGENSLASDFSREGMSTIDTDEVDPIAEAEVYLAYGRDAQAEEILKDALKKDGQRQEVYLKLLEIHAQHNKPSAFDAVAAELYAISHGQGEIWQKASTLGRQLDPNNPMFSGDGAAAAAAAAAGMSAARAPLADARPAESPRAPESTPTPVGVAALHAEEGMDFRLDEDLSIMGQGGQARKPEIDLLSGGDVAYGGRTDGQPSTRGSAAPAIPERAMSIEERIEAAARRRSALRPRFPDGHRKARSGACRRGRVRRRGRPGPELPHAPAGSDRARQARPVVRPGAHDLRGPDALGARWPMA